MSLISYFVNYFFSIVLLPLFFIFFIGKPIFLVKILNKLLHFKIQGKDIILALLGFFSLLDLYFIYAKHSAEKKIKFLIKMDIINVQEYSIILSQAHAYERNIYIFLTCIAMLLTMHKFGERHLRIAELNEKLANKETKKGEPAPGPKNDEKKKKE